MTPSPTSMVVRQHFIDVVSTDANKSPALAAIETLYNVLMNSKATTVIELTDELKAAIHSIQSSDQSTSSVASAGELFMRFISLAVLDQPNFDECRKVLVTRGQQFLVRVAASRSKIVTFTTPFIKNASTILTHSYSRVVTDCLVDAATRGKSFHVFVTESRPEPDGYKLRHRLAEVGVPCTVILDAAVAYVMEKVDMVFVGAEAVVETGGIINRIGTLNIALAAKAMNKPMYVLAESVKFVKEYPLNQRDVPDRFKYPASVLSSGRDLTHEHPLVDYTPPDYIKLLFTDLGILTPAAVSDELIKLYL